MNSLNNLRLHELVVEFSHIIRGGGKAKKLWTWGGGKAKKLRTCTRLYGWVSEWCQLLKAYQSLHSSTSFFTMMFLAAASCHVNGQQAHGYDEPHRGFRNLKGKEGVKEGGRTESLWTCSSLLKTSITYNYYTVHQARLKNASVAFDCDRRALKADCSGRDNQKGN